MGQLQHGVYNDVDRDECEGLTQKEINAFYDFGEDGEPQGSDEDANQSDEEQEEVYVEEYEESENGIELDEPGCRYVSDPDHDFDMEV
jgi:hypothetical protein